MEDKEEFEELSVSHRDLKEMCYTVCAESLLYLLPARYEMPPWSYPADEGVCQGVAHFEMEKHGFPMDRNMANWQMVMYRFKNQGSRVYVVTPELIRDMERTSVKGIEVSNLKWPIYGMSMILPREMVYLNDEDQYLTSLTGAVLPGTPAGTKEGVEIILEDDANGDDPQMIICVSTSSGAAYSFNHPIREFTADKMQELGFDVTDFGLSLPVDVKMGKTALATSVELFVKILTYMNAIPEDEEKGVLKAKGKKSDKRPPLKQRDFWKPWIIGLQRTREAKVRSGSSPSTPGSRIPHWRSGHWRQQPCGKDRSDVKVLWIKPTLIKGTKCTAQSAEEQ